MIKCCFISFGFLSLVLMTDACRLEKKKPEEALRFESLLRKANLPANDSIEYLVWNNTSCGGCRSFFAGLIMSPGTRKNVKAIVPYAYAVQARSIDAAHKFIDTAGVFDELYFGIDNVGIIGVSEEGVYRIRNYRSDEMDRLAEDLKQ